MVILASVAVAMVVVATATADAQVTGRASVSSTGVPAAGGSSSEPSLSDDGRLVVFSSLATNLVSGDTNGLSDVFLHDRQTGMTTLISRGGAGEPGNGASIAPVISGDGSTIVFASSATNIDPAATVPSAYAYDVATGSTTAVQLPNPAVVDLFLPPRRLVSVSTTGRYVAVSGLNALPPANQGPSVSARRVYVVDRVTSTVASIAGSHGVLSGSGRYLAFGQFPGGYDGIAVGLLDLMTNVAVTLPVPTGSNASECAFPAISSDGLWVAFECARQPLVGAFARATKIYLYDRQNNTTTAVSAVPGSQSLVGRAFIGDLSSDGQHLVFSTTNPIGGHAVGGNQIFRYDRVTGTLELLSVSTAGQIQNQMSFMPAISSDGRIVAFASAATHLVAGDTNASDDIFVVDPSCTFDVAPTDLSLPSAGGSLAVSVATGGRCSWVATSSVSWITLMSAGAAGPGQIILQVAANTTGSQRNALISVAGRSVSVLQAATTGPTPPGPPVGLTATVSAQLVTLSWDAPAHGSPPTGYVVAAGSAPGRSDIAVVPTGNTNRTFAGSAPNGTYYVRVSATSPFGSSLPSNEVVVQVGCTGAPPPPSGLSQSISGQLVSLAWGASNGAASYVVFVGSAPGLENLAALPIAATSLQVTAPAGTYHVHVRAQNTCGTSVPSNAVVVTVAPPALPGPPSGLNFTVTGGRVSLWWQPPTTGVPPIGYLLEAGSQPGLANLAQLPIGLTAAFSVDGVPAGTYFVRIRAIGVAGAGPPSNEVVVVVPPS